MEFGISSYTPNSCELEITKKRLFPTLFVSFPDLATRKCSEDGFWIGEDGIESMDPSWTNFTGCFTADVAKVLDGFYGVNSSSKITKQLFTRVSNV